MKKKIVDFTEGSIVTKLIVFMIPIVLGNIFQNLYNTVDAMIVGRFVGTNALAAVSVSSASTGFIASFFTGMSIGASVISSKAFGTKDEENIGRSMRVTFTFSVLFGAALSLLGFVFATQILNISQPDPAFWNDALIYLQIYLIGMIFTSTYNIGSGILRAIGDSSSPTQILLVTSIVNIVLDLVFVAVMSMGTKGAAIATVIAQAVSAVLVYIKIKGNRPDFRIAVFEMFPNMAIVKENLRIGIPSGLQYAVTGLSNVFVWKYINKFGPAATAGVGAFQKVERLVDMPGKGFGSAVTTFVGQNMGAKNYDRVKKGVRIAMIECLIFNLIMSWGAYFFAEPLIKLFIEDPEVIRIGVDMLRHLAPLYFVLATRDIYLGALRGFGDTKIPTILTIIGMVGVRQVYLAISSRFRFDMINVYNCYTYAWFAAAILMVGYYVKVKNNYLNPEAAVIGAAETAEIEEPADEAEALAEKFYTEDEPSAEDLEKDSAADLAEKYDSVSEAAEIALESSAAEDQAEAVSAAAQAVADAAEGLEAAAEGLGAAAVDETEKISDEILEDAQQTVEKVFSEEKS